MHATATRGDAGADAGSAVRQGDAVERDTHALRDRHRLGFGCCVHDRHKLVAADTKQLVACAELSPQRASHLDEEHVARLVPELVVDGLEVIDVDGDHRSRSGELAETLLERTPVANLRQRIGGRVERLLLEETGSRDSNGGLVGDRLDNGEVVDVPTAAACV